MINYHISILFVLVILIALATANGYSFWLVFFPLGGRWLKKEVDWSKMRSLLERIVKGWWR